MDPVSQAFIGAAAAQSFVRTTGTEKTPLLARKMKLAMLAGILGGMAPDLDVFIRSSVDPLLALQFHRHFTHALVFIPIGGALVGLLLFGILRKFAPKFSEGLSWKLFVLFATLGWATHGLLDSCTSYGTQLFWPFSDFRVAWNNVGIIDPIPTFLWIAGSYIASKQLDSRWARTGFVLALVYLSLGFIQRDRALEIQAQLLAERGHTAVRRDVKPTILQLFVWKSIYEFEGRFYSDAIRVGLGPAKVYEGTKVGLEKFDVANLKASWTDADPSQVTVLESDIRRFDWFSDGWVARIPSRESNGQIVLGDVRYSMLPQEIDPMWGIEFDASKRDSHVAWVTFRSVTDRRFSIFGQMIKGEPIGDLAGLIQAIEGDAVIGFPPDRSESGIDAVTTVLLMSEIEQLMRPLITPDVVAGASGAFAWDFDWEKPWIGAGSLLDDHGTFKVMLWGGFVRATKMTLPALEATICHEFGHLLAGQPKQRFPVEGSTEREEHWSSAEGQSDWFAATVCLPKLYRARGLSDDETQSRVIQAGLDFAMFSHLHFDSASPLPSLATLAKEVPEATLHTAYPSLQCRLDTFHLGARCSNPRQSCPPRPRCWFAD